MKISKLGLLGLVVHSWHWNAVTASCHDGGGGGGSEHDRDRDGHNNNEPAVGAGDTVGDTAGDTAAEPVPASSEFVTDPHVIHAVHDILSDGGSGSGADLWRTPGASEYDGHLRYLATGCASATCARVIDCNSPVVNDGGSTIPINNGGFEKDIFYELKTGKTNDQCVEARDTYLQLNVADCTQEDDQLWTVVAASSSTTTNGFSAAKLITDQGNEFKNFPSHLTQSTAYHSAISGGSKHAKYYGYGKSTNSFLCGAQARWHYHNGIIGLKVKYCDYNDWFDQEETILIKDWVKEDSHWLKVHECPEGMYVTAFHVRHSNARHVSGLEILCASRDRSELAQVIVDCGHKDFNDQWFAWVGFYDAFVKGVMVQADNSDEGVSNIEMIFGRRGGAGVLIQSKKFPDKCIVNKGGSTVPDNPVVLSNCYLPGPENSGKDPQSTAVWGQLTNDDGSFRVLGTLEAKLAMMHDKKSYNNGLVLGDATDGTPSGGRFRLSRWGLRIFQNGSPVPLFNNEPFSYESRGLKGTQGYWSLGGQTLAGTYATSFDMFGPWWRSFSVELEIKFGTVLQFHFNTVVSGAKPASAACLEFVGGEQECYAMQSTDGTLHRWNVGQAKVGKATKLAFVQGENNEDPQSITDARSTVNHIAIYDTVLPKSFRGCFAKNQISNAHQISGVSSAGECQEKCFDDFDYFHTGPVAGGDMECVCMPAQPSTSHGYEPNCDCTGNGNPDYKCVYEVVKPKVQFNLFGDFIDGRGLIVPSTLMGEGSSVTQAPSEFAMLEIHAEQEIVYPIGVNLTVNSVLEFSFSYEGELAEKTGVCINKKEVCFWIAGLQVQDEDLVPNRYGGRAKKDGTKYIINLHDNLFGKPDKIDDLQVIQVGKNQDGRSFFHNFAIYDPIKPKLLSKHNRLVYDLNSVGYSSDIKKLKALLAVQTSANTYSLANLEGGNGIPISANGTVEIQDLQPGKKYRSILTPIHADGTAMGFKFTHFTIVTSDVISCACDEDADDFSGRPFYLEATQKKGFVSLAFEDNSQCEEAFVFEREGGPSEPNISYAPNYYYYSENVCDDAVIPPKAYEDDLSESALVVGRRYIYCVAATARNYMGNDSGDYLPYKTSSLSSCVEHYVVWEASVDFRVQLTKKSGGRPVRDVRIRWTLYSEDRKVVDSGSAVTPAGGNVLIQLYATDRRMNNKGEYLLEVSSEKQSGDVEHVFLCDNESRECAGGLDTIWLRHLEFDQPMRIVDNTTVPVRGKVMVDDTEFQGSDGCPIVGARVCSRRIGDSETSCFDTDSNGDFVVAATIGTVIELEIEYESHTFQLTRERNMDLGLYIEEGGIYAGYDFYDMDKTLLVVEVAGGLCNKTLGESTIEVGLASGCKWKQTVTQQSFRGYHPVPAHVVTAKVVNLVDKGGGEDYKLTGPTEFLRGTVETIDLRRVDLGATQNGNADGNEEVHPYVEHYTAVGKGPCQRCGTSQNLFAHNQTLKATTQNDQGACGVHCIAEKDAESGGFDNFVGFMYDEATSDCTCCASSNSSAWKGDDLNTSTSVCYKHTADESVADGILQQNEADSRERALAQRRVRFQYDGQLQIEVSVLNDRLGNEECRTKDLPPKCSADDCGYHVIRTGSPYIVNAEFKNVLVDLPNKPPVTCDLFDDDAKVTLDNSVGLVGLDDNGAYLQKLQKVGFLSDEQVALVQKCGGGCTLPLKYDVAQSTGKKSRAHISEIFISGRPKTDDDFLKSFFLQMDGIGYTGHVYVVGDLFVPGTQTFQFPTHTPLLVLRDPPGSMSHVSYENVLTTVKIKTYAEEERLDIVGEGDFGVGAWSPAIPPLEGHSMVLGKVGLEAGASYQLVYTEKESEHTFSSSWSYTTSEDPLVSGAYADVALVPNLNVVYQEVTNIAWASDTCIASKSVAYKYDLESPDNAPAFSFLTMTHVEETTIPTLKDIRESARSEAEAASANGTAIDELHKIEKHLVFVSEAATRWEKFLSDYKTDTENMVNDPSALKAANDWFAEEISEDGSEDFDESMKPKDHWTGLVPKEFADGAESPFNSGEKSNTDALGKANRIHFVGGGAAMEFSLTREQMRQTMFQDPDVLNKELSATGSITAIFELTAPLSITVDAAVSTTYTDNVEASLGDATGQETSITVVLGDDDVGDDFTVDIYLDPTYNTFMFHTVGGASSCPHEPGTKRFEDPVISIKQRAPAKVAAGQPMIFDIEMYNKGGAQMLFELAMDSDSNTGDLRVEANGGSLALPMPIWLAEDTIVATLVVYNGPEGFKHPAPKIWLRSECEYAMAVFADRSEDLYTAVSVELGNVQQIDPETDEMEWMIEFAEPCPKVSWASSLDEYQMFVLNSTSPKTLDVMVYNLNAGVSTLLDEVKNGRLKSVLLKYRKIGSNDWLTARAKNTVDELVDINFAGNSSGMGFERPVEDVYGYAFMSWAYPEDGLLDGQYELRVECECDAVAGAPDEFNVFMTSTIPGVLDRKPPKLYGQQQIELGKKELHPANSINLRFTEPIQCTRPYTFDVEMSLDDAVRTVDIDKDDIEILCKHNELDLLINSQYLARNVTLRVSGVEDLAGNQLTDTFVAEFSTCDPAIKPEAIRKGMGCDGVDDNCDLIPDDCGEDLVMPEISLPGFNVSTDPNFPGALVIGGMFFRSSDDAVAFLEDNIVATDDCASSLEISVESKSVACEGAVFAVTAADPKCASNIATKEFVIEVLGRAPVIEVGFDYTPHDYYSDSGNFLHIDEGVSQFLEDVKFWYKIVDVCLGKEFDVDIQLLSNEASASMMGRLVEDVDARRHKLWLQPQSCRQEQYVWCKTGTISNRIFDIRVTATDKAGNVGSSVATVVVADRVPANPSQRLPQNHYVELVKTEPLRIVTVSASTVYTVV